MLNEDLDIFFADLAVDATYDGATAVKVIFDNEYVEGFGIHGTAPVARGKASDFPVTAAGKTLVIDGVTYTIRSAPEPIDDGALVRLHLKKN